MTKFIKILLNPEDNSIESEYINLNNIISFGINNGKYVRVKPYFFIKTIDKIYYRTEVSPEMAQESVIELISSDVAKLLELDTDDNDIPFYFNK